MRTLLLTVVIATIVLSTLTIGMGGQRQIQPVYVGSRVCGSCHSGESMGHQFSLWMNSRHAMAYAALAKPEAKRIAKLSGIDQEPQAADMCLGCHATAAQAEDWEREDSFFIQDGVQCERCHGPGSEYMSEGVMRNREAAREAGLKMPEVRDCLVCHAEKGSHVAVLDRPKFDFEEFKKRIAHPTPPGAISNPQSTPATEAAPPGPRYVGTMACAGCHGGPEMGYQYSRWRLSGHARAYSMLATPAAAKIAGAMAVDGDPQKSPVCLRCHSTGHGDEAAFLSTFSITEGVGCEACHGPGSEYIDESVMTDKEAARAAGLKTATRDTCVPCHDGAHEKPFTYIEPFEEIAHPTLLASVRGEPRYKTPLNMAISPGGQEIYVACEASDSVVVVDTLTGLRVAEIEVGGKPADVAFHRNGKFAYVSNRFDDTVSAIDVASRQVLRTVPVGDGPHGLLMDREGKFLYVLNTSSDSISVIDAESLEHRKELSAGRAPWSLSLSPDGSRILVTHALPRFGEFRSPAVSEIAVVETDRAVVADRLPVPGANLILGVDWHPGGEFALATLNRTKNLVPMTRLLQGWTITNGLAVIWRDGRVDQVLLDEPNLSFPDPTDIAFTRGGDLALVSSSASDRIAVLDVARLVSLLRQASPSERSKVIPNHLGKATEFVIKHIPVGKSPRGILIAPDGATAFIANSLDDSLTVVDLQKLEPVGEISLGGPQVLTEARRGERLFNSSNITFQRQFSCHTCHPDGHVDGITFDIEPDGIGVSPVDNRTLRGILDTAPFKWEGTNPSLQRQCGPRLAVFFTRLQPFNPEELSALEAYIQTIPRPLNRYHPVGSKYTPAQRRGKAIFERTKTNGGRPIPVEKRCVSCHPPPLYTDHSVHDIGTKHALDGGGEFDTPHLNNVYDSAPYLHNGMAKTLEEIWTLFNPYDQHGVTNDLTKDQLNNLIEFLKTL